MRWVVVGTDNFSYDSYPLTVHIDRDEALAEAARRDDEMKRAHPEPDYFRDTYRAVMLGEACRICELSLKEMFTLIDVLTA